MAILTFPRGIPPPSATLRGHSAASVPAPLAAISWGPAIFPAFLWQVGCNSRGPATGRPFFWQVAGLVAALGVVAEVFQQGGDFVAQVALDGDFTVLGAAPDAATHF